MMLPNVLFFLLHLHNHLQLNNWTCQICGAKATEVHHKKYAKYQIGKEPIQWLVSLCSPCHRDQH